MKNVMSILLLTILLGSCKAKEGTNQVLMVNNSNQKILFLSSLDFPDTISFRFLTCSTKDIALIISPNETKPYNVGGTYDVDWEAKLSNYPMGTRMFLVYDADSAAKIADGFIGCDSLYARPDLILKRFDVDINYLIANDWRLTYP